MQNKLSVRWRLKGREREVPSNGTERIAESAQKEQELDSSMRHEEIWISPKGNFNFRALQWSLGSRWNRNKN